MAEEPGAPRPQLSASQILQISTALSSSEANGSSPSLGGDLRRSTSVGANSASSGGARDPLDPKWIEIMMGKDDAVRMRDCGKILQDPTKTTEEKLAAFDELEMLVESMDNANNLGVLNLWKPMIEILKTNENPKMRQYAAWVMGTSVQNNPEGQRKLMEEGGLAPVVQALKDEKDLEARSRILYCISGLLKKNPKAREQFQAQGGLDTLADILKSTGSPGEVALQRKAAFMVKNLIVEDESLLPKFRDAGVIEALENILLTSEDQELVEKLLGVAIVVLRRNPDAMAPERKALLKAELDNIRKRVTGEENGQFTLDPEDLEDLEALLAA
ncbi:armadillo-type protein [Hyaloraphidium curvatum]|nr:armadillo-type protein [Hyaloraphidium curvatum]